MLLKNYMEIFTMLRFEKTCEACPEQYDVFDGDKMVAYLRLRFGHFYAQCPFGGEVVYEATIGDGQWDGCFDDEDQRRYHLKRAEKAIEDWMERNAL
jgi:hypothetical protein